MDRLAAELRESLRGAAVKAKHRRAILARYDLHVSPTDPARQLVAGERLVGRLLRGQANGEMLRGRDLVGDVRELVAGEQPIQHALPKLRVHAFDPVDLHGVDADAGDHVVERTPLSAASSAIHTRSAVSNVLRSCTDHARHNRRSSMVAAASAESLASSVSAPSSGSMISSSSASSARRAGPGCAYLAAANSFSVSASALAIAVASNAAIALAPLACIAPRRASSSGAKNRRCSSDARSASTSVARRPRRREPNDRSVRVSSGTV